MIMKKPRKKAKEKEKVFFSIVLLSRWVFRLTKLMSIFTFWKTEDSHIEREFEPMSNAAKKLHHDSQPSLDAYKNRLCN